MLALLALLIHCMTIFTFAAPTNDTISLRDLLKRTQPIFENFDDTKPEDVKHKLQLQSAWSNSIVLMHTTVSAGFSNSIFSHYFDPGDKDTVSKVFQAMYGNNPDAGSPNIGSIIIDNEDFTPQCVDNVNRLCYTEQRMQTMNPPNPPRAVSAGIHCCMAERANRIPELSGSDAVTCDSLGNFVSYKMFSLSAALLHEYTHFDIIGGEHLPKLQDFPLHVGDMGVVRNKDEPTIFGKQPRGYGPYKARTLPKKLATRNADSYTWLAIENYWTKKCTGKTGFTGPNLMAWVGTCI